MVFSREHKSYFPSSDPGMWFEFYSLITLSLRTCQKRKTQRDKGSMRWYPSPSRRLLQVDSRLFLLSGSSVAGSSVAHSPLGKLKPSWMELKQMISFHKLKYVDKTNCVRVYPQILPRKKYPNHFFQLQLFKKKILILVKITDINITKLISLFFNQLQLSLLL